MPFFNRLLILAVLAVSATVRSAPPGSNPNYGIAPTPYESDTVQHSPAARFNTRGEDVGIDTRADLNDEELDEDTSGQNFALRDFDGEEDVSIISRENVDAADEDADVDTPDLTLEARAATTTKAASKQKPTKTKTPKAKPTKPGKPGKSSKTSKAAKPTGTAAPNACPIKNPGKNTKSVTARAYDYLSHLFNREDPPKGNNNPEFVGWHGTNSDTAALWKTEGYIKKPVKSTGFLDYLRLGVKAITTGTSGADAEVGPGLYLADNHTSSIIFANINAMNNKGTTPMLCAIFAKSSGNWRNVIRKVFIPEDIVKDSKEKEQARVAHIKKAVPGVKEESVVRFALFDRKIKSGQMVIPELVADQFSAKCFKVEHDAVAASDLAASKEGTKTFPDFQYNGATLREEWMIVPENAVGCK